MRRLLRIGTLLLALVLIAGGVWLAIMHSGCNQPPRLEGRLHNTPYRSQRLMALAAAEAGAITDVDTRLTRQLNLADAQIQRSWPKDAALTLEGARKTLGSPDAAKLNSHARISGWVSVSELSRAIKDNAGALAACDGAVAAMNALDDPARRCEYVMGVANELQYLRGLPAAAELLIKAGPWTRSIDDLARRRQALVSFASALFNLDSFDAGQQMLRQDEDAAWRSDTLATLAMRTPLEDRKPAAAMRSVSTEQVSDEPWYGRRLNYGDVFRGQKKSQTAKD